MLHGLTRRSGLPQHKSPTRPESTSFGFLRSCVPAPLTNDLVENNSGSHRDVERRNFSKHGYRHQEIAFLAYEVMHALALSAQDDCAIHPVVERVVGFRATLVEPHHPNLLLLELFDGARNICNPCNGEMLTRTRRRLRHYTRHGNSSPLGNYDAVCAGS